ncbi:hypothetical protein [Erwinia sp. E602]|nr:hypothetical protein [Erwinia sp. E602]
MKTIGRTTAGHNDVIALLSTLSSLSARCRLYTASQADEHRPVIR